MDNSGDFQSLPEYGALHSAVMTALDDWYDEDIGEDDSTEYFQDDPTQIAVDVMDDQGVEIATHAFVSAVGGVSDDGDIEEIVAAIVAEWQADRQL